MRLRRVLPVLIALPLLVLGSLALADTPTVVRDEKGVAEGGVGASRQWITWNENPADAFRRVDAFAKRVAGGPRVQLNPPDTHSFTSSVDGSTAVFDFFRRGSDGIRLDLMLYDLQTGTRSKPPAGVNTKHSESQPSLSGYKLFFTRDNFESASGRRFWVRLVLFDVQTGESTLLRQLDLFGNFLISNQVNGDFLTWERCRVGDVGFFDCEIVLYEISSGTKVLIPNPGKQQYASSVSRDGTVYFTRGGQSKAWRCGTNVTLYRDELGGGPAEAIATVPKGIDVLHTFAVDEANGSTTLYLDREKCATGASGVFKIADADSASL